MKSLHPSPKTSQPDNKPMSYGGAVRPSSNKSPGHTPSPVGRTTGSVGKATDSGKPANRGGVNLG